MPLDAVGTTDVVVVLLRVVVLVGVIPQARLTSVVVVVHIAIVTVVVRVVVRIDVDAGPGLGFAVAGEPVPTVIYPLKCQC